MKTKTILALALITVSINAVAASTASQVITTSIPTVCGVTVNTGETDSTIDMTGASSTQDGYVTFDVTRNSTSDLIDVALTVSEDSVSYINTSHSIADVWSVSTYKNGSSISGGFSGTDTMTKDVNGVSPNDKIKVKFEVEPSDIHKLEGGEDHTLTVTADVTCA